MACSPQQLAYFAHKLTLRGPADSMDRMAGALLDAQVDLNPHQIDAALFATSNPLSKGAILADEVGLGKTIEAGLLIAQRWAERKRRLLIITPANLRKQWHQEAADKFGLPAVILEAKSFRQSVKDGTPNPFDRVADATRSDIDSLYALPNSQRQLITLVLRKLLASSTFAIAGARTRSSGACGRRSKTRPPLISLKRWTPTTKAWTRPQRSWASWVRTKPARSRRRSWPQSAPRSPTCKVSAAACRYDALRRRGRMRPAWPAAPSQTGLALFRCGMRCPSYGCPRKFSSRRIAFGRPTSSTSRSCGRSLKYALTLVTWSR